MAQKDGEWRAAAGEESLRASTVDLDKPSIELVGKGEAFFLI